MSTQQDEYSSMLTNLHMYATLPATDLDRAKRFYTEDIEAEVAALKSRGVTFEEYDTPYMRTVDSIAVTGPVKAAWFKDSEGNVLSLVQYL